MSTIATFPASPSTNEDHPKRHRWLGSPGYWICQLICWGGLAASNLYDSLVVQNRSNQALEIIGLWLTVLLGTHCLRAYVVGFFRVQFPPLRLLLKMLLAIALTSLVITLLFWIRVHFFRHSLTADEADVNLGTWFTLSIFLGCWTGIYVGISYYRGYHKSRLDRLRLESAIKDAELRALRAQVDPHFLFNSLNTLRALIPHQSATPSELSNAREAITQLADVLRTSLLSNQRATVPLSEELEHVANYLALEKLRFESRLQFKRIIDPDTLSHPIPPLLLQTLVENAIKYGIAPREAGGLIELHATLENDSLRLTLTNPGTLNSLSTSTGLGLKNARARLDFIFGSRSSLELTQPAPDSVRATLLIPASEAPMHHSTCNRPARIPPFAISPPTRTVRSA